jgi:lambda family phage tail tape measure protein
VSDFRLKVIAETQTAERNLKQVGEVADKATKSRSLDIKVPNLFEVTKTFQTLERDVKSAANTINTFYKVGKALPGSFGQTASSIENVGKGAAKSAIALNNNNTAAEIFGNTLKGATTAAGQLVTTLAKVGLATFAIKETVGVLQAAFNGFFNNTIGREIKLRETILKTQTTLASTNKVFKNGKEITDPYQKIVTLTGAVQKNIDSIRERSIALAGVTSNDVIEVFGIVASQVGQIGGGLKEAEDLAINFAAALGTFGIPLYQANQEIGSILRGQITEDSRLATALGIRSPDIAKAKGEIGGVVKFLEDRLAASVAGQKIAAQGFSGVVSNIRDLGELVGQNFGRGMLQPLLNSLTAVFETLFRIRTQIFDIASKAGETVGRVGTLVVGLTAGRTGVGKGVNAEAAASAASGAATRAFSEIESVAQRTVGAISQVIISLKPTALILVDAFRNVAEAFVQIKVGTFEALASAIAALAQAASVVAPPFATLINLYARFLNTPIVQYFAEVSAVLGLLKRAGLDALTSLILFGRFVVGTVVPVMGILGTTLGAIVGGIAAVGLAIANLTLMFAGLVSALITPAAAIPAVAAALSVLAGSLSQVGNKGIEANTKLASLTKTFTTLGATAKAAGASIAASLGWMVAIQVGIAIAVDAFGRYKRAQEDAASSRRALEALRQLQTTYKDVGDTADSATKSARDFKRAIVDAEYNKGLARLEEIRQKIADIRNEMRPGVQNFGEFLLSLSQTENQRTALAKGEIANIEKERQRIQAINSKIDAQRDKATAEENVKLIAQKQADLSKEYAELQRQQQSDLFQQRQALAQKEVEIFRAAGELRIYQMEQANAKLIEGEEGASRTALEALNNYLSVRENGELEIEAAKKDIVIEVANLEKTIADYRFENEKKIAEIRKRAGQNEMAMADARRQAEGQGPGAAGAVPADVAGRQDKAMQFFMGKGLPRISSAALVGGLTQESQMSTTAQNPKSGALGLAQWLDGRKTAMLSSGAGADFNKQLDFIWQELLGPENAAYQKLKGAQTMNQALLGAASFERFDGYQSIGAGSEWGDRIGYTKDIMRRTPGGAAPGAAAATPTPALQSLDVGAPGIEAVTASMQRLNSAFERQRQLAEDLTNAQSVAAFERIAKEAFPEVQIENYLDSLAEAELTYDAITSAAAGAFNPELSALAIRTNVEITRSNTELAQIIEETAKREKLSEAEKKKLIEQTTAAQAKYVAGLRQAQAIQASTLVTQRAGSFVAQLKEETAAIYDNLELLKIRTQRQFEGVDPAIVAGQEALLLLERQIKIETNLVNEALGIQVTRRSDLQKEIATASANALPALQKQLDEALAEIARLEGKRTDIQTGGFDQANAINARMAAETEPGAKIRAFIGDARRELADLEAVAVRVSQSIGDAIGNSLANGITGLIEGTTSAKEVFADFLKDIGQILLKEATKMIAVYIAIGIAKAFAGLSSGGSGSSAAKLGSNPNVAAYSALPAGANGATFANGIATFANGGTFTNSIVSSPTLFKFADGGAMRTGLMGEAGPEAIMPLKRGADGRLGVSGGGGGPVNVTVNVDASGNSQVAGDQNQGAQLGRVIAGAVQQELIKQQRPGGLLAGGR